MFRGKIARGRTRVLSQNEYKELQFSEKKKRQSVKIKEDISVPAFDNPPRLSFKSNKKITIVENISNHGTSKVADAGDYEKSVDASGAYPQAPTPEFQHKRSKSFLQLKTLHR